MFYGDYREDVSPESLMARARGVTLERDRITDPQALLLLAYGGSREEAMKIQKANQNK